MTTSADEIWAKASRGMAAAAVILDGEGHVLLVKHSYGKLNWEIPGGAAERDESPTQTAIREVLEETGVAVTADRLTGVYCERHAEGREVLHFVFLCNPVDSGAVPQPSDAEITACGYWAVDALPRPINDFTVRRIHDAFEEPGPKLPIIVQSRQWLSP